MNRTWWQRASSLAGMTMGFVAWLYLGEVGRGIAKHAPPCAPITEDTVRFVYGFTAVGVALSMGGLVAPRIPWTWRVAALLGLGMNAIGLGTWHWWLTSQRLLPYEEFLEKMGWG